MASSGVLYSGTPASNVGLYGAKQKFIWSAKKSSEPGITDINWELHAVGKENASTNTRALTECIVNVYDYNNGSIVGGSGQTVCNYYSGDGVYVSYKGTKFASGTFQVKHTQEGVAGFKVTMDVNIGGWKGSTMDAEGTFELDENVPYFFVYIDNGAACVKAIPYIDDGTNWKVAEAYIDDGTKFKVCT